MFIKKVVLRCIIPLFGKWISSWIFMKFFNTWNMQCLQSSCKKENINLPQYAFAQYFLKLQGWTGTPPLNVSIPQMIYCSFEYNLTKPTISAQRYVIKWVELTSSLWSIFSSLKEKSSALFLSTTGSWELLRLLGNTAKALTKQKAWTYQEKAFLIALEYNLVKVKGQ